MKPVLLERQSDTHYRIHILRSLLQEIECVWDTDFFIVEVLDERLQEDWGYEDSTYNDYRYHAAYFDNVEQAKKFAQFVQRMLFACIDKDNSETTTDSALIDF